ncbi:MAG: amidophosphoribosyltransferase [Oscillospiraceae bacterium]|nr:amidophosphoribosyltransferase [Oscillospiraceae bacterium]
MNLRTGLHEECGVFGIFSPESTNTAELSYAALFALQHRGQESCGIVVNDRGLFSHHKDIGLVQDVFSADKLAALGQGTISIGHVRYSTTGSNNRVNAQPLVVRHIKGPLAIAHNGNLVNAHMLRERYELRGAIFQSTNDTEVISYCLTEHRLNKDSIERAVEHAMYDLKGAYSLVIMSAQKLIAARDPNGFRPLVMGSLPDGSVVFASETCALDAIGAVFERDLLPGEIIVAEKDGIRSIRTHCGRKSTMCVFEYVYFARPDSVIEGCSVHKARLKAGELLWKEHPVDADVVIGVPDSGLDAALGFSHASGIPYGVGFIKNRYVGRTFIQPSQQQRTSSVALKLNAVCETVAGKRVVLIDDSIVRGTTSARIVGLLRNAGAKEIHFRVSCPPFTSPCYFGTDIDSKEHLIACRITIPEICRKIGADSLGYLSVAGVQQIAADARCGFCTGCFTGDYPIAVPKEQPKDKFENKIEV